jgi:hypothetical protein
MITNMKTELTSKQYWALPEIMQANYQQVSLVHNGFEWVERTMYGHQNVKIKTVYKLKEKSNKQTTFRGLGMGTF